MNDFEDPFIGTSKAARILRLSSERIRQLSRNGSLTPDLNIDSGQRLWRVSTIEAFAETRRNSNQLNKRPSRTVVVILTREQAEMVAAGNNTLEIMKAARRALR